MSAKSSSPREHAAAALSWLVWAKIAEVSTPLIRAALGPVFMSLREEIALRKALAIGYVLYYLVPQAITALGLLRFIAPMEGLGARRWAHVTLILIGLNTAYALGLAIYGPTLFTGLGALEPVAEVGASLVSKACTMALLMTVWRGCQQLAAPAPQGLFILAVALTVPALLLEVTGALTKARGLLVPGLTPAWIFLATHSLALSILTLIVGALTQARTMLRRTQDMAAVGLDWEMAARGLTLYLWSLGVSVAGFLLTILLRRAVGEWYTLPLFILILFSSMAVMSAGLLLYARMPETSSARGPVYLALIVVAPWHMASLMVGEQPLVATGLLALAFAGQASLIESFRRVATALDEQDLAETASGLRFWLPILNCVLLALQHQSILSGDLRFLVGLVAVAAFFGWVNFLQLANRLKAAMRTAAMPQQSLAVRS